MKVIKSNSISQYNFCGINKSIRDNIGNSYVPNKSNFSSLKSRITGDYNPNQFKLGMSENQSKDKNKQSNQIKSDSSKTNLNKDLKTRLIKVNKPATFDTIIRNLDNLGKSDFSKESQDKCIDDYYKSTGGAFTKQEIKDSGACR